MFPIFKIIIEKKFMNAIFMLQLLYNKLIIIILSKCIALLNFHGQFYLHFFQIMCVGLYKVEPCLSVRLSVRLSEAYELTNH